MVQIFMDQTLTAMTRKRTNAWMLNADISWNIHVIIKVITKS